jgi:4-hydroxy-tetrahydrodipicolinate synthase
MLKLKGVIPPLVTPLSRDEEVDTAAAAKVVEHVLAGGVHGVFILGTMGEGAALDDARREAMARAAAKAVAGRVPLIAGVIEMSTSRAVATARVLARTGVDALVVMAPCYFRHPDQAELLAHFRAVVEATDLPVVIYDNPHATKNALSVESVLALAEHPRVVALKDSTGDISHFAQLARRFAGGDFALFQGNETQLDAAMLLGARGLVVGMANLTPALVVELYECGRRGDREHAGQLQEKLLRLQQGLYYLRPNGFLQGMKTALSLLGLCQPWVSAPHLPLEGSAVKRLEEMLRQEGIL